MKMRHSLILIAVFVISVISVLSCVLWTDTVSLVDYSIRDKDNEMVKGEKAAIESPIEHSNPLVITVSMDEISRDNLLAIINASEKIKTFFAERNLYVKVASLSTVTDYKGEKIEKFINVSQVMNPNFDSEKWFRENKDRLTLKNSFLGKIDDYYHSSIIIFPEEKASEIEIAKTFLLFKAQWNDYQFDWWKSPGEWSWENLKRYGVLNFYPSVRIHKSFNSFNLETAEGDIDIVSQVDLKPGGWTFFRLVIDALARLGAYLSLGIASVFLVVFSFAALGTSRKVLCSLSVIALSFTIAKGSTGIINQFIVLVNALDIKWFMWLANDFFQHSYEDVFAIEAFFALMISGISFPWHYLRKFNREMISLKTSEDNYWKSWQKAKEKVNITRLIAIIAVFDFLLALSLANYQGSRAMWQIGIMSSIGVASAWILTNYFLPIFYFMIGGLRDSKKESQLAISRWLERKLQSLVHKINQKWVCKKNSAIISVYVLISVFFLSIILTPFLLKTDNDLGVFVENSASEDIYRDMNKIGGIGSTAFTIFVSLDLHSPKSLDSFRVYLDKISRESRMTYSPFYFFLEVLEEDYGYEIGTSIAKKIEKEATLNLEYDGLQATKDVVAQEIQSIIESIWDSIVDEDTENLFESLIFLPEENFSQGKIEVITTFTKSNSKKMIKFRDDVLIESAQGLKNISVEMAGKISQYLEIDRMISDGRWLWNILSQLAIIFFCMIYFIYRRNQILSKWRISSGWASVLVALPFIWATAMLYIFMMVFRMPFDVASASIGAMAVAIAIDFPLFVVDFFGRSLSRVNNAQKEDAFELAINEKDMINSVVDVIVDYMGSAILFAFMMATPVVAIKRLGFLEEWVLFNCIFATVFLVLPMLRWTIIGKEDAHIIQRLRAYFDEKFRLNADALEK